MNFRFQLVPRAILACVTASTDRHGTGRRKTGRSRSSGPSSIRNSAAKGAAVGDFNHDGKLDIAAGSVYYAAPDWKMVAVLREARGVRSAQLQQFVLQLRRRRQRRRLDRSDRGRFSRQADLVVRAARKGRRALDAARSARRSRTTKAPATWTSTATASASCCWASIRASTSAMPSPHADGPVEADADFGHGSAPGTDRFSHGIGAGDINGDGRNDVLVTEGWWEAPADKAKATWTFHPANFGEHCSQMHVYDFDGDGDNDVLSLERPQRRHLVARADARRLEDARDRQQLLADARLCLADINGDKLPDFVTGKRWWAHGPKGDARPDEPAVMFWFELTRKDGKPVWIPHEIDHDSGVGTQFEVADVNGDGLLDVVTANKKGAHYFEQVRK